MASSNSQLSDGAEEHEDQIMQRIHDVESSIDQISETFDTASDMVFQSLHRLPTLKDWSRDSLHMMLSILAVLEMDCPLAVEGTLEGIGITGGGETTTTTVPHDGSRYADTKIRKPV